MTLLGVRNYGRKLLCWRRAWLLYWLVLCDSWPPLSMEPGVWSVSCGYGQSFVLIVGDAFRQSKEQRVPSPGL